MNTRRRIIATVIAVLSGVLPAMAAIRADGRAPDFSLTDTQGKTVTLSAMNGKVVFLDFWASWCPPCRMSIPKVQQLHDRMKESGVVVIGINVENNARAAANFAKKERITYTIAAGDGKVERDYRISSIPAFYIIGKDGKILKKYEGYYPGMEKEWETVIKQALTANQKATKGK